MIIKAKARINRPLLIAACFGVVFLLLFSALLFTEASREKEKQINHITHDYIQFQNHIENFFTSNINLMTGFSAYIQTFDQYEDEDVYSFLEILTKNNSDYIMDIGIIQDTTIKWIYPVTGNEKAIGTDLSKIPDQSPSISYVKNNLAYHFDGPKQLVQGGTGYIIRMPIIKDNVYWGMVSMVLDADKVQKLFDEYAKECDLEVAIVNKSNQDKLIYGDTAIMKKENIPFNSTFAGNQWTIYVVSEKFGTTNYDYLLLLALFAIIFIFFIDRYIYNFFSETERVKEKNNILNHAVFRDRLTGLYNRSFLDVRIQEEIDHANRYGSPLSIVFFDLDHFKRVNDNYGHSYGDAVLREISRAVKYHLRSTDVFARWGGEEFAILMRTTRLSGAVSTAEKIRAVIEEIEHPYVGKVTASFGAAEYLPDEYAGSWFKRVDNALYQSKANGRNQVTASKDLKCEASALYRINWKEEWSSGNSIIDTDHKKLLDLGNQLVEDSYTLNNLDESISRYNELLNHISTHFEREEMILENAGYTGLDEHKASHQELLEESIALREKLKENKIDTQSLYNFLLKEVVIGHQVDEDTKFFYLLRG